MHKAAAALIALACWAGIALQFWASYTFRHHDLILTLWTLARFFTIIGNLALALTMTAVASGKRVSPLILGGLTLAILLVGIVYRTLLAGLHPLQGLPLIANYLLHDVSPIAMAAYWLLFVPSGRLRWSAPWWWVLFPGAYLGYALARGQIDHHYPYPFIDVG
ncbi:MAG TPA: Pr6Pr family membrane protein, partial [Sphingomicrobium sp.]